jgi:enamine deaminase RidA (YjgF/YER057c/UK114 family)|tara:strand:+ start:8974 stop:9333 length:360 start_codon:yes stop_codon:yes gene_type:complete
MVIRKQVNERMSKIVEYSGVIYLAGIVSDDKDLDIKGQAQRVLAMAEERLAEAGSNKDHILRAEIFVKDIARDFAGFNEVWDAWVSKEQPPARACVEANMASSNTLVEIIFTAVKSRIL